MCIKIKFLILLNRNFVILKHAKNYKLFQNLISDGKIFKCIECHQMRDI